MHLPADERQRAADGRKHAQAEDIDLQEAERLEVVLVPLDHGALGHRRVLDRHQLGEQAARDHETARMLGEVPRKAAQHLRELHPRVRRRNRLVPEGEALRHAIDFVGRHAERLANIAQRAFGTVTNHRRCKRRAPAPIFAIDVLDHLLAPLVLEIDVDVRRLVPLARNEALEQHVHPHGVDLGDAERVAHDRVRCRAASLAQDVFRARIAHQVLDGEEERLVTELGDERELVLHHLAHLGLDAARKATAQALLGQLCEPARRRVLGRHQLRRILVAQLVERELAALGDAPGLFQ